MEEPIFKIQLKSLEGIQYIVVYERFYARSSSNSIRLFSWQEILDISEKDVPGFYSLVGRAKLEILLKAKILKGPIWGSKDERLFYTEGCKLHQFDLLRNKLETTFEFEESLTALTFRADDVFHAS